jgi:photosystem II stability/assembly factor-like uncharacterized protein
MGKSWVETDAGLTDTYIGALAVIGNNILAKTYRHGIFLSSNNGRTWTPSNDGLMTPYISPIAVIGGNLFAGDFNQGGVFRSSDSGISWTEVGLRGEEVNAFSQMGNFLFASTETHGIFRANIDGSAWHEVNSGLSVNPSNRYSNNKLEVFALASRGNALFAGTSDGVYRTTNNGTSWTAVHDGFPTISNGEYGNFCSFTKALAVIGTNLFAGTMDSGVYLSTNSGASWTPSNNGLTKRWVQNLTVIDKNLFALTDDGDVLISTDNGITWIHNTLMKVRRTTLISKKELKDEAAREKKAAAARKKVDALLTPNVIARLASRFKDADQAADMVFHINAALGMEYSSFNPMLLNLAALSGANDDIKRYFQKELQLNPPLNDLQLESLSQSTGLSYDELKAFQVK